VKRFGQALRLRQTIRCSLRRRDEMGLKGGYMMFSKALVDSASRRKDDVHGIDGQQGNSTF
jgi:hypothetical protein